MIATVRLLAVTVSLQLWTMHVPVGGVPLAIFLVWDYLRRHPGSGGREACFMGHPTGPVTGSPGPPFASTGRAPL